MKRTHSLLVLSLIAVFLLAIVSPSFATEDTSEDESTETTIATDEGVEEEFADGEGPALQAPPPDDATGEQPWTARFIYPALGGLTVLLIVGIVVGYNHKVRNRYKVVS